MYDDPWYWLVLQNKGKKHVPGQRKPTIDLDAFTTPEKPVAPMINFRPLNAPRLQRSKSTYLVGPPPAPLNLQKEFDIEAQCASEEITQEEMDWAYEQMERDNEHLISIDGRYVQSLEQDNEMLRSQLMACLENMYRT